MLHLNAVQIRTAHDPRAALFPEVDGVIKACIVADDAVLSVLITGNHISQPSHKLEIQRVLPASLNRQGFLFRSGALQLPVNADGDRAPLLRVKQFNLVLLRQVFNSVEASVGHIFKIDQINHHIPPIFRVHEPILLF